MAWLTLATGLDRWEQDGKQWRLKEEGPQWLLVSGPRLETYIILKPEVADWCWENVGPYRLYEHVPSDQFGPDEGDSWRIEFKTDTDAVFFKMRWW